MLRTSLRLAFLTGLALGACAPEARETPQEDEEIGTASEALSATDPVSKAVQESCTTAAVRGLSTQLVQEIQCLRPGTMKRIDGVAGIALGAAVFPYLQTPAADGLIAAQKARKVTLSINSGLRTLPQQFLLYRWYQQKRCNIGLAAKPGTSNHESAIAVDVEDNAAWRSALESKGFRWLGASDPVHYDFTKGGTVDLRGLSVKAFQRLWNRNHPDDKIAEDGDYGADTEVRLAKSPTGGFPIGAAQQCPDVKPVGETPPDIRTEPDATEPSGESAEKKEEEDGLGASGSRSVNDASAGCAAAPGVPSPTSGLAPILFLLGLAASRRRRPVP